jgi:hypothetical protein
MYRFADFPDDAAFRFAQDRLGGFAPACKHFAARRACRPGAQWRCLMRITLQFPMDAGAPAALGRRIAAQG